MNNAEVITIARNYIDNTKGRSAWMHGVKAYAHELIDTVEYWLGYSDDDIPTSPAMIKKIMLDGACDWRKYSWGGCALIYNRQIAERLCTPSELKKTHNGMRRPNSREDWLDTQARALYQAERIAMDALLNAIDICVKM